MQSYKIAIIGLGTVGMAVAKKLEEHKKLLEQKTGIEIEIKKAIVRDVSKYPPLPFELSERLEDVLEDDEISMVVELIGGVEYPFEIAKKVFEKGKAFVTANKAMIAFHSKELMELSKGLPFGFEASVCGGIPIIEVLRDSLSANEILGFEGILNGTSNFILTQMFEKKQDFFTALCEAQRLGYAESNPSLDINGGDAGHKLLILAKMAYGIDVGFDDILIEGIEGVKLEDLQCADELGYCIKLLGIAKKENELLDLRLHLALIPKGGNLSSINGVKNAINLKGDCVGELFLCGLGAGGDATASSVIADIVHIVRLRESKVYPTPAFGYFSSNSSLKLKAKGEISSKYYLRFEVSDRLGALAEISAILADSEISVSEIVQKSNGERALISLITHLAKEEKMQKALSKIAKLDCMLQTPYKIRIYE